MRVVGLFASALSICACIDRDPRPATWQSVSTTIMQPRCGTASCHSALSQTAGVVLDTREDGYRSLVAMPPDGYGSFVVPGDPSASALLYLLRGEEVDRMPPDAPLSRADVELVEHWIAEGAQP
jgi:hypothetical protein